MKKNFKYAMMFAAACTLTMGVVACGDDENDNQQPTIPVPTPTVVNTEDYDATNAVQWGNYMVAVANLLEADAKTLYNEWNEGYADLFKQHNSDEYKSAIDCVEQILDGCIDISDEVGNAKIGDPYNLYQDGQTTAALYAVESWYSWHSREDYRNNIYSIRNAFYGTRTGDIAANSLSAVLDAKNPELNQQTIALIEAAANAIWAIPQPFRNNINSQESVAAMDACAELWAHIENFLKPYFQENINDDATLDPVVKQYVDVVVLPTYKELSEKNAALNAAVKAFQANPSDQGFVNCANAWLDARTPWEQSEAFLFGPVDELGLDPNMDSWPLDQASIAEILKSNDFSDLNWAEGDSDEKVEEAQSIRGFHTLEYLIFKDGVPRTITK